MNDPRRIQKDMARFDPAEVAMLPEDSALCSAVIFDLDGTLADTAADIAEAANAARQAFGLDPLPTSLVIGYVGDGVQCLLERALGHDLATGEVRTWAAADELNMGLAHFRAHYAEHLLDRTCLYPGIAELLIALKDRSLFVATNKPRSFTLSIMRGLDIDSRFLRVVAGDDVSARKPDPSHLAACLAGTGLTPQDVVVVGDGPNDILAARRFGCRVVGVTWGLTPCERLSVLAPDALVDDVPALARELGVRSG